MTHSDAAFVIGKAHKICQDYALTGDDNALFSSVWLSDGCSSSLHTDIGARLLTHRAVNRIPDFATVMHAGGKSQLSLLDDFVQISVTLAGTIAGSIGVPADCLNATLLGLVDGVDRKGDRTLYAVLYGDGALVCGMENGERVVFRSEYPANFPFYPAYLADVKRRQIWERVPDNRHTITRTVLDAGGGIRESETLSPEDGYHLLARPVAGLQWAAILSDGIESFQQRSESDACCSFAPVDYLEVIRALTAFKNFTGGFVQRRMQSFAKECSRRGWHHNDDISVAALHFGDKGGKG
ncbi:MAG: protein phosphatase 2C domain-containing protein [Akkermansiaceae bacterium]|nr:protein phosphatase 2C domain-containing protein [Armatimonadota bacterium]